MHFVEVDGRSAADLLAACAAGERPFLLEGDARSDGDGLGELSYAGCDPIAALRVADADGAHALAELAEFVAAHGAEFPSVVGYTTYELGRFVVPGLAALPVRRELGLPLVDVAAYGAVVERDERTGRCRVVGRDAASVAALVRRLGAPPRAIAAPPRLTFAWQWDRDEYCDRVVNVLDHLRAGDAYQINLTQALTAPLALADALGAYLTLRRQFGAPLGGYLQSGEVAVLANSPELLLRRRGRRVETRPIKGTRRRVLDDAARDRQVADELRASAKDDAEHIMIVDLERNDLGRVAEVGSVKVEAMRRLISLPTVHHVVSTVSAELRADVDTASALAAIYPGGSVTGAPKRRAMEIIDALEGRARGVYCGSFGWFDGRGDCDLALPIRTAIVTAGMLTLGVGGGIVVDSDPDAELAECHDKAAAFVRALGA